MTVLKLRLFSSKIFEWGQQQEQNMGLAIKNIIALIYFFMYVLIFLPELRVPKARFQFPVWIQHWSIQQKTCPVWYNPLVSRNCQWYIRYVRHKLWSCSSLLICKKKMYIRIKISKKIIKEVGNWYQIKQWKGNLLHSLRQSISIEIQRGNCARILGTVESDHYISQLRLFQLFRHIFL